MSVTTEKNKRIAKNTLLLYIRMLFVMAVNLYTSRVVLKTLGIEDFGIYNVVGGVVTMFSFINNAMVAGTQRYLTFELGREDFDRLKNIFSVSLLIHFLIALLILLLAETIGLWFLYNEMNIPAERLDAAFWVFQFSVLSIMVMIISAPYNAVIIAHERMGAFAYISVLEVILKLLIVYFLFWGDFDKLKLYALLIFTVQLIVRFIYSFYCNRHFMETKYHFNWDRKLFTEMVSFAGWNLWGNFASVTFMQGVNILLNIFFGPTVNAARSIAVQVQQAVTQFSLNFQMALNPQITKSYSQQDFTYMHNLIYKSSKLTFFLLLFLSLPIIMETETILAVWLGTVPAYTATFVRLMLCITIIDATANPLMISAAATGKIKIYQSTIGGILLAILPVSYLTLKMGGAPSSVFIVHLCICIVAFIVRLFVVRPLISLSLSSYVNQVIIKCITVAIIAVILPLLIKYLLPDTIYTFIINCVACIISISVTVYCLGLNKSEKAFINSRLASLLSL